MSTDTCSSDQPRPKGPQGSRWALERPQEVSWDFVHSLASLSLGEPVRRGPSTSVSSSAVCITCELVKPSSRMRVIIPRSTSSSRPAACSGPNDVNTSNDPANQRLMSRCLLREPPGYARATSI
jgi:hypothetical protein